MPRAVFRYTEIFQNYAKEILKLSYRNLPPWLEEGYSTVYGNVTFNGSRRSPGDGPIRTI